MMNKNVDHDLLLQLLDGGKHTYPEIAAMANCSPTTVLRYARTFDKPGRGRGTRHLWQFKSMTPELAYIIGFYLGEGSAYPRCITWYTTDNDSIEYMKHCLECCELPISIHVRKDGGTHKGAKTVTMISTGCKQFAQWLKEQCSGKDRVPPQIFTADIQSKISFIASTIDGDGTVGRDGSIKIRGVHGWIKSLHEFITHMGIKSSCAVERILPSGKGYWRVTINRGNYRAMGGYCMLPWKQARLLDAKDTRIRPKRKNKPGTCPQCSGPKATPQSKQCFKCHSSSPELAERLRKQAGKAGRAGSKARWG